MKNNFCVFKNKMRCKPLWVFVFLEKMTGWMIKENGGDGWKLEDVMVPHPNEVVKKNFVTSFE